MIKFNNSNVAAKQPVTAVWIAPTLLNSWTNLGGAYEPAGYYKDDMGIVHVRGIVTGGTTTLGTPILTFPAGYRPLFTIATACVSNNLFGSFQITSAGNLNIIVGSATSFSLNFSFRAEQ